MTMKKIPVLSLLMTGLLTVIFVISCGKKKPEGSQYEAVCAKVAKCDRQMAAFPEIDRHCVKMFVSLEQKLPGSVAPAVECINNTPCEELSFAKCSEGMAKNLQGMVPGLPQQ
jgi:hypothetical protein